MAVVNDTKGLEEWAKENVGDKLPQANPIQSDPLPESFNVEVDDSTQYVAEKPPFVQDEQLVQTQVQNIAGDDKVVEVTQQVHSTPDFRVTSFTTSVKVSLSGLYSTASREMTIEVGPEAKPDQIKLARQQAMDTCISEAVSGALSLLATGRQNQVF